MRRYLRGVGADRRGTGAGARSAVIYSTSDRSAASPAMLKRHLGTGASLTAELSYEHYYRP